MSGLTKGILYVGYFKGIIGFAIMRSSNSLWWKKKNVKVKLQNRINVVRVKWNLCF